MTSHFHILFYECYYYILLYDKNVSDEQRSYKGEITVNGNLMRIRPNVLHTSVSIRIRCYESPDFLFRKVCLRHSRDTVWFFGSALGLPLQPSPPVSLLLLELDGQVHDINNISI